MNIHYLQHVSFEGLGQIAQWAENREHSVTVTRLYEDESFPSIDSIDYLIVLGGPMNIYEYDQHPWLKREKAFIKQFIDSQKPILGICLGAQLIADTLGARTQLNPDSEIGWFDIDVDESVCKQHACLSHLSNKLHVMQWHSDTFMLPDGAERIASSPLCENQAFVWQKHVIGFQFHIEWTKDVAQALIEHETLPVGYPHIQSKQQILNGNFNLNSDVLFTFLDAHLSVTHNTPIPA